MSEEIDYAEMLEIPVATVNVVKKKRRRLRDLKSIAVGRVNERMQSESREKDKTYAGNEFLQEPPSIQNENFSTSESEFAFNEAQEGGATVYEQPKSRTHPVLVVEFAVACFLCLAIFLTNVFVTDSAINTFIRMVLNPDVPDAAAAKTYSDFTLSPVVSEYADVETELSSTGLLSFSAQCSVYPACDATVSSVTQSGETYTVVLSHSSTFESVYTGLNTVYYAKGDSVRSNVPFGYTNGESPVQVSFYEDGEMLNCYSVDSENCLSWNK